MPVSDRVDAERNRVRLLAAARTLLARDGVEISLREVARDAGVGVGTLYRHFPTRDDLVDAVLEDAFAVVVEAGERALAEADPWTGFTRFIEQTLVLCAANRGLKAVVETRGGRERAAATRERIRAIIAELVDRAQVAGALRADFAPQDVALVLWGSDHVTELAADVAPELWRRHLGFVLDGLRASAATPLAQRPLCDAELQRIGTRPARER